MIRKIKRLLIPIVYPIFKSYWFIRRPTTYGVKCLVWNNHKLLLVKMSYGHKLWTIPGGGIKRKEKGADAAKREVKEETGVKVISIVKIGEYKTIKEYKNDTVYCYSSDTISENIKIDETEITDAEWFSTKRLPEERTKQVNQILELYNRYKREL